MVNREELSDCNCTRTQNHLVRKRTLSHLTKLKLWNVYITWQEHTVREDLIFEKYKYTCNFQQFETTRYFTKSIIDGKIDLNNVDEDQSNLLDKIMNFKIQNF